MIELPEEFYRPDGLPMSRDEFMLGPFAPLRVAAAYSPYTCRL